MAAPNPEKSLQDEATCSICLDYFQHPMMIIDCGHNFCRDCIAQCCAGSVNVLSCPQCRKPFPLQNIRPNRHLWNIVELAKQFSLRRASEAGEQKLCKKHQEPLKLFCEQDQTSICVVCDRSKLHKNHTVTPIEEAAHVYQEQIQHCLKTLKEERNKVLSFKLNAAMPSEDLLREAKAERQNLLSEFQQLHQVLKKKEQLLLDQLEKLEKEVEKRKEEHANNFSGEISRLNTLIGDLEQKCREPPSGLLQDIGNILNRCRRSRFHPPTTPDSSELKKKLQEVSSESAALQAKLRTFRETLTEPKWIKENVTLDVATAHPRFVVSPNQKSVRWGTFRQELPYNARRFDPSRCVLGCQGFSSGRHQWTVDVNCGTSWAVGIARESVQRKGPFSIAPEEGIWAIGFYNGHYKVLTSPPTVLNQSKYMTKIQISLDYEGRSVAFFDADEKKSLFLFSLPRLKPDKIFPFFRVGDMNTVLCLC